ncbi:hypothetical protein EV702DRAFT_701929 [Suillus placidus]|uniref:Uncharacterized protein n=1 Tax=Suillus placidus TaxID=48579 RepID=A0A9P6ZKQ3_9AGAM|nr:hypothetical protein EV702DRAFT_701929 [Suillus placidus]
MAKTSRSSFLSQPARAQPVRPEKGKDRASSGQSSSSLSDHISTMLQKQNVRLKRAETARKTARKTTGSRRVSTSDLIRAVQKPSSSSEVSSAATRVRRVSDRRFPRGRPPPSTDVIELTDSSGSARRRRARGDEPIIISSSDADTPPRQPQPSQTPNSRKAGPKRPPPPDAEVICISDSDDDNDIAPSPAAAVLPIQEPSPALPSSPPIVMESENEIVVDLEHQVLEDSYYELMEPESNFDEELARSELQRQTEELFSYIDLDPPEPNLADRIASPIAHDDCNAAEDPHVPAPDILTDSTLPSLEQATGTSSSDTVLVETTSQRIVVDTLSHLESSSGSKIPLVAPEVPSQTHATVPTIAKPSITWNYTPPTTNPFFARALTFNAKALKIPLPLVAQISNEPNATTFAAPAIVGSSTANILPKPLVYEQASDVPAASSHSVSSPSPVHLLPRDGDRSVLPPLANEAAVDTPQQLPQTESRDDISAPSIRSGQSSTCESAMKIPISMSDILAPPATAPPSSVPVPVPPRVQRPIKRVSLTELINKRREEHFKSHPSGECIDLTDDVSPSSGGRQAPSVSKPQGSVQPPHITSNNASSLPALVSARQPAPTVETRTPSIQEIRDLMRQRPSSSKLGISSAASNPSASSAASATSAFVPNISPPRSITSNSTSSSNQSSSMSSSRRKGRSIGMTSLEMFISPISDKSQPASTKKTTPPTVKRTPCNADVFRRIITPTAEMSVRSPSLSPSEGRRTRRVVRPPSLQGMGASADDAAAHLHDQPRALPEPLKDPGVTSTTSPFVIPAEGMIEVQSTCMHEDVPLLDDVIDDMLPSEDLQGVTESIGSLDLHEHSRSPEVDINVNQVGVSRSESICEDGYLEGIPVSAELMEYELESLEMLVDDVSAESVEQAPASVDERRDVDEEDGDVDMKGTGALAERMKARSMSMGVSGDSDQECLSVLMQLEASDGEEVQIIQFPSTAAGRCLRTLLQGSFLNLPCLPVSWASPAW